MSELQPPNTVSETDLKVSLEHNLEHSLEKQDINTSVAGVEKNQRKPWLALLLLISIGINGIALFRIFSPAQQVDKPATAEAKAPRAVEVTTLSRGNATRTVQLLGQVESPQQATIRAQTGGIVKQMLVQAGDKVTRGTTIAILDDADQKLTLSQAQAQLAQQRSELARLEVGTRPEIIAQREAAVKAARAREAEAVDNLQRRTGLVREGAIAQRLLVEARAGGRQCQGRKIRSTGRISRSKSWFHP